MALQWFRQAADQSSNEACAALGFMCADGRAATQSHTEAVKWFRTAADRGLKVAQAALGFMYSGGRGVPHDYVQAYMWLCVSEIAEHGEVRKQLDAIAAKMSPEQRVKAKQLARDWKPRQ
jgi:TPR repeat protein